MTITEPRTSAATADHFELVALDLYRDIHKGIRAELFDVTTLAGRVDPDDREARGAMRDRVVSVSEVLGSHAHHEDGFIEPVLQLHRPDLAEEIAADHERLEAAFGRIVALAGDAFAAAARDRRRLGHLLYLDLATFTSRYLAHQDLEERVVMPALEAAVGIDEVGAIHGAIVGAIAPDEMARSLAFMLPSMHVLDQAELLGGMRAGAPAEVFEGVLGLAQSVLPAPRFDRLLVELDRA